MLETIINEDSLVALKNFRDNSFDLLTTDPPYGYSMMGKNWDKSVPSVELWQETLRVLKPGAFAFIMSAPRSDVQAEMIKRLESAGFVVSFSPIYWTYFNGLSKAANISKLALKRKKLDDGDIEELDGAYAGFQPKPAVEVILVAMKPLSEDSYIAQAEKTGLGVTWLDDCKLPAGEDSRVPANILVSDDVLNDGETTVSKKSKEDKSGSGGIWKKSTGVPAGPTYSDYGSKSRFFSLDNWWNKKVDSLPEDVKKTFPFLMVKKTSKTERNIGCDELEEKIAGGMVGRQDGSFDGHVVYNKNHHPTVKPIELMSYLITLGSREGDLILDPFVGSGSTSLAAKLTKRNCVGIELDKEYSQIAKARLDGLEL